MVIEVCKVIQIILQVVSVQKWKEALIQTEYENIFDLLRNIFDCNRYHHISILSHVLKVSWVQPDLMEFN